MTGLVLAGGRGTRMGADKALVRLDGRRLVDIAVATLAAVCDRVLVATGTRPLHGLGVEAVPDSGEGPLSGIVAGLRAATADLVAVIAVDMPRADPEVLQLLAGLWEGQAGVAPVVDGVVQPLHAVYARARADDLAALAHVGEQSPRRALEALDALLVGPDVWGNVAAAPDFARSVNSPRDLAALAPAPPQRG